MPPSFARLAAAVLLALAAAGCYSPYPPTRAQNGAVIGGLGGAGVGALVGDAVGRPGVGALVGAGVGALSGAAVGNSLDQIDANNQAQIAARLGHAVQPGAVTVNDVISMSRAGVPENVIVTHIQRHGVATPLQANDLISMQQQGVSPNVVQAMQAPPVVATGRPMLVQPAVQPVIYAAPPPPPYYGPAPYYYRAWRPVGEAPQ